MRSDVEETETEKTKDSGYSNSSNSQSQRSSGSSKSTSSGSSGFRPSQNQGDGDKGKRSKEKKKKEVLQLPEPPEEPGEPGTDLGSAALAQTLTNVSRILPAPEPEEVVEKIIAPVPNTWKSEELAKLVWKENAQEEELGIVVSMEDGLVTYTTPTISAMLGYPKDMWVGRSLIDFVHPRHRASFAGHITSVISDNDQGCSEKKLYLCYLRQYRGLRNTGYSLAEKWVGYLPLQLSMSFKGTEDSAKLYLVINAILVRSAYKNGDETRLSAKFTMRHTSSSQICHVDLEVTPYFGYLPQDILGRSILEFYHPEDLHFLKEVYEAVMKEHGHLFRSKPYRFRCQNGGFALVESELSSFINPWSRKLEFIICQHTVLRGPPNPDVTTPVNEPEALQISEEVLKETEIVQEEIKCLLSETVVRNSETAKQQVTRRCKDLAAFMENLLDEVTRPPNLKVDVPTEEQSISERDSVMLGEISPHHEYYDSKSSSETPPSYNQLNYNENMQRFFESKPNTTMPQGSPESKIASGGAEEGKISPVVESIGDSKSGGSGGSSGAQSTESNENSGETNTNGSNENSSKSFKPATLTEELLTRHNEDMEKKMVQKHREQRTKSDTKTKDRMKTSNADKVQEEPSIQGVKRSGSHSWEGEPYKSIKAEHTSREPAPRQDNPPPFFQSKQEFSPAGFTASPLLPLYYLANRRPDLPIFPQQVPYVPSMVYQPVMLSPQPVVYSPLTVVSGPELPRPAPSISIVPPPQATPHMMSVPDHGPNIIIKKPAGNLVQDQKTESNETSIPFEDSNSSFYSLLKTDKSDESLRSSSDNDAKQEASVWQLGKKGEWRPIKKVAPWDENITVTPELVLKYQLQERPLADILSQDLNTLATITQPELVSEQLSQMYLDLEKEGVSQQLEGVSCSSESSSEEAKTSCRHQEKKYMEYDKMAIMFEEDAPLPPPILQGCT